ncbi:ribosome silencing factor [Legionella nagasakiensis]|uniref:ribosome silencing factor n=1 Tax=Legionella nagasakiensis TaxID=535290 RepID=UPI001056CC3C|nr:ribosome silencing factor [Legionella nagasakiensis]
MPDKHPLLETLIASLEDIQANEITVLDVRDQTSVTDYMVICNGRSSRHVKSIAEHVMEQMKAAGLPALSHHGLEYGEWALIDFGDFVVHVMQPENRAFYNLEGLWQQTS